MSDYTKHNFLSGTTIQPGPFNEMDDQIILNESNITDLTARVAANEAAIATLSAPPDPEALRAITADDCFSDTTHIVLVNGAIYVNPKDSYQQGPYTHIGIKATTMQFTHDFSGPTYDHTVYVGMSVKVNQINDLFVGYPLRITDAPDYMAFFTDGGDVPQPSEDFPADNPNSPSPKGSFRKGSILVREYLSVEGTYTITAEMKNRIFTIRNGSTIIYQMTIDPDVRFNGFAILRYGVHYGQSIYDVSIVPMATAEEEAAAKGGNSIAAEYYLKGNASKAARTKKLCIIGAGQSNMYGYTPWSEFNDNTFGFSLPISGMKYIKNSLSGSFGNEFDVDKNQQGERISWGFDAILCHYLVQNLGTDNLYYIKWAHGGTAIDPSILPENSSGGNYWTADYEKLTNAQHSLLRDFEQEIRNCAENENNIDKYEIGAMIWHQGEADSLKSGSLTAPENYYSNLKKVIAYCRGIVGNPRLPFIFGTVAHENSSYDATVDDAMHMIDEEDPYVWLVNLYDAKLVTDTGTDGQGNNWSAKWHFNGAWNEYMGKKYYDCLIEAGVITGNKLNPAEPSAQEEEEET